MARGGGDYSPETVPTETLPIYFMSPNLQLSSVQAMESSGALSISYREVQPKCLHINQERLDIQTTSNFQMTLDCIYFLSFYIHLIYTRIIVKILVICKKKSFFLNCPIIWIRKNPIISSNSSLRGFSLELLYKLLLSEVWGQCCVYRLLTRKSN